MARLLKEDQRKSKVVAVFPDERSALLLVAAKLKRSWQGEVKSVSCRQPSVQSVISHFFC